MSTDPLIVMMSPSADEGQVGAVVEMGNSLGCQTHVARLSKATRVGILGDDLPPPQPSLFEQLPGVAGVERISVPHPLASREFHPDDRVVELPNGVRIGGTGEPVVMAGPCAVESEAHLEVAAQAVHDAGGRILRGGAFKPRTSPYSFQGLGERGLELLRKVADRHDLAVVTEVLTPEDVPLVAAHAEMLQIGARNMQNYSLLRAVGRAKHPVLLKRGMGSTIDELLLAAEYILAEGNQEIVLCERGIRTFETSTRSTLDISAVPVLRSMTSLPVIVDPSHATGRSDWVTPVALAAIAAGAHGLIVEMHPSPGDALCDGKQSITPAVFAELMRKIVLVAAAVRPQVEVSIA
jgi:3-deoxy-7-phosphoheptulonate synthase